jgi:tetratricopeptide (TPR) repeat protein
MDLASGDGGAPLARVAHGLGVLMDQQGEPDAARRMFERSLAIWRELGDRGQQARQLNSLGITYRHLGQLAKARAFLEEAVALNRDTGNMVTLADSLANLGQLEGSLGRWDRAMDAVQEALQLDRQYGSPFGVAVDQSTLALATLRAGHPREARDLVCDMLDYVASSGNTAFFVNTLELAAVIVGALDDHPLAARLLGAAQTARHDSGMQISEPEAVLIDELLAPAYAAVTPQKWDAWLAEGRALSQPEALALLRSLNLA